LAKESLKYYDSVELIMSKTAVFGIVMFSFVLVLGIIAFLLAQPVVINVEADIDGNLGELNSSALAAMNIMVPEYDVKVPYVDKEFKMGGMKLGSPEASVNADMGKSNLTLHLKGNIQAPIYALVLYQLRQMQYEIVRVEVPEVPKYTMPVVAAMLVVPAFGLFFRKRK
jgi:hypothetical protein